jgi:phage recombination protein Bet
MNQKNELQNTVQTVDAATLKNYLRAANLVGHLSDVETDQFIQICTAFGLNPFKREIYASKYGNNFSIVVGYETYIKRAERSGLLSGWKVTTEGTFDPGNPSKSNLKAIIVIHRTDFQFPFEHEVYFSEYCQRTKAGQLTKFWAGKPITMIKKVVMSQGFRLCFSDELGGLPYTKEETGQDEKFVVAEEVTEQVTIQEPKIEPKPEKWNAIEQYQEAKIEIEKAENRQELTAIWRENVQLQDNINFVQLFKNKSEEFKNESESKIIQLSEQMFSTDIKIKDLKDIVLNFTNLEELENFAKNEKRSSAIEIIEKRIHELKSNKND